MFSKLYKVLLKNSFPKLFFNNALYDLDEHITLKNKHFNLLWKQNYHYKIA